MSAPADRLVAELAEGFERDFRERVPTPRTVGREAEFPVVGADGRAGRVERLWDQLLAGGGCEPLRDEAGPGGEGLLIGVRGGRWSAVAEVGRGTVEVVVGPRPSLHDLAADLDTALRRLIPAARRTGLRLLGYGIQPRTPPHRTLMTPKRHYGALLRAIGPRWLRFAVTASDQVHLDVTRDELIPSFNLLNAVAGALIALTANSPVYGGRLGGHASGRERLMAGTTGERYRHGAIPRPFVDVEDYVRWASGFRCLCLPDGRGGYRLPSGSYLDHARRRGADLEEFLFHEHYLWPSARPRARLGTLEVRPACQQPWDASWAPAAMAVGLGEALSDASLVVEEMLGPGAWPRLLGYRAAAVRVGVRAPEPAPGFLEALLDVAEGGLKARGFGEETFAEPLRERVAGRSGPADLARRLIGGGGVKELVDAVAWPEPGYCT
jgi:glutamate--cysteine ligase